MDGTMDDMDYEEIGRFIFGVHRCGGDKTDIARWMADDLGMAIPDADDEQAVGHMYRTFFAKYEGDRLKENYARLLEAIAGRH